MLNLKECEKISSLPYRNDFKKQILDYWERERYLNVYNFFSCIPLLVLLLTSINLLFLGIEYDNIMKGIYLTTMSFMSIHYIMMLPALENRPLVSRDYIYMYHSDFFSLRNLNKYIYTLNSLIIFANEFLQDTWIIESYTGTFLMISSIGIFLCYYKTHAYLLMAYKHQDISLTC